MTKLRSLVAPKGLADILSNIWPLARPNIAREGLGGLKLTSEQAGIGLRRESVDFLDIQKVETLILRISALN